MTVRREEEPGYAIAHQSDHDHSEEGHGASASEVFLDGFGLGFEASLEHKKNHTEFADEAEELAGVVVGIGDQFVNGVERQIANHHTRDDPTQDGRELRFRADPGQHHTSCRSNEKPHHHAVDIGAGATSVGEGENRKQRDREKTKNPEK